MLKLQDNNETFVRPSAVSSFQKNVWLRRDPIHEFPSLELIVNGQRLNLCYEDAQKRDADYFSLGALT